MLGQAYRFVIFVFVHGGLGILFVIAVAHVLCVGRSSVFTRSCRSCTDVGVRSTLWQSRRRVSGTEGCPSRISSGSSNWTTSRPQPGSTLALAMIEFCTMACGGFGSLLRCHVRPMAVQPIFVPPREEERVGGWVKLGERVELKKHEELEEGSGASRGDVGY